ncbi:MAG TPA: hypothetical protein VFU12_09310 [Glycomyces sp.]|nr:hypothetical protein [Glycomyces sp.]
MSGWTVPPNEAVPPGPGIEPPPAVGMHGEAAGREDPERTEAHRKWAEDDAEAARHVSTADLRRDAERTRERLNRDVVDLRHKFGLDRERGAGPAAGPFAPVRRHPLTVAVAAAGATTAALIGLKMVRDHRRDDRAGRDAGKDRAKAAKRRGATAQRRLADAKDTVVAAASSRMPRRGRSGLRRVMHR